MAKRITIKKPRSKIDFGVFFEQFKEKGIGAEIGVQYGYNALRIIKDWTGDILCVDLWNIPDVYEKAKSLLVDDRIKMIKMPSVDIAKSIADESLDWVYIDADHWNPGISDDIKAWFPKVRKGGIISGHDYADVNGMNVIEAVDEFCKKNGYKINITEEVVISGEGCPSWWFIK